METPMTKDQEMTIDCMDPKDMETLFRDHLNRPHPLLTGETGRYFCKMMNKKRHIPTQIAEQLGFF